MERDDEISLITTQTTYTNSSNYTSNTNTNTSKLLNIKPGQAIRVKAPNKKSRAANGGNFATIG